jgi:hypothetical protein
MPARWWRTISITIRCWWLTFLVGRLAKMVSKDDDKVFKVHSGRKVK